MLHHEAGAEQPTLRCCGGAIGQGGGGGLPQIHQTGAGGVGARCQLGPELNRIGAGGTAGQCRQAVAAAGGGGPLVEGVNPGALHLDDEAAARQAQAKHPITDLQRTAQARHGEGGVAVAAGRAAEAAVETAVAVGLGLRQGAQGGGGGDAAGAAERVDTGCGRGRGSGDAGDRGAGGHSGPHQQLTHLNRALAEAADFEGGGVDRAAEDGHRIALGAVAIRLGNVAEQIENRLVGAAQAGGEHAQTLHVLHGGGGGLGQGAGDGGVEAGAGGEGLGVDVGGADVDGIAAALQRAQG